MLWLFILLSVDPLLAARRAHDLAAEARVREVYEAIDAATTNLELRRELRRICKRESWCNRFDVVGHHDGDAWASRRMWSRAVEKGWLDPEECPEHELALGWHPRGVMGISPAWTLRFVEGCVGPEIHDDPVQAVNLAVEWVDHLCDSVHACTCEQRVVWWQGPGVWKSRGPVRRLQSVESQCGRKGFVARTTALARYSMPW